MKSGRVDEVGVRLPLPKLGYLFVNTGHGGCSSLPLAQVIWAGDQVARAQEGPRAKTHTTISKERSARSRMSSKPAMEVC
jgi:hypothetical protein